MVELNDAVPDVIPLSVSLDQSLGFTDLLGDKRVTKTRNEWTQLLQQGSDLVDYFYSPALVEYCRTTLSFLDFGVPHSFFVDGPPIMA